MKSILTSLFLLLSQSVFAEMFYIEEHLPNAIESLWRCEDGEKEMCSRALSQSILEKKGKYFVKTFEAVCSQQAVPFECSTEFVIGDPFEFGRDVVENNPKRGVLFFGSPQIAYIFEYK